MVVCFLLWNHRKLRKDQIAAKILLHLCASLLCVLIVFVAGVERGGVSENACRIVAAFIHYFLLVAFLWMLIEAYFMYQAFVKVFRDYGDYVMWKCAAMGWGESFEHVIDIVGISNILEWLSPRVVIGFNISRHLTKQNHSSLYSSQTFSRALHRLHVLDCLRPLWLTRVITFVLVLRQSVLAGISDRRWPLLVSRKPMLCYLTWYFELFWLRTKLPLNWRKPEVY